MKEKTFKQFNTKKSLLKVFLDFLGNLFFIYCVIVSIALIIFSTVTVECDVDGASMYPTLNSVGNDIVYINTLDKDLDYKDIIVVKHGTKSIVKRVLGLPGDTIDVVWVENEYKLEINGTIIIEDYINISGDVRIDPDNRNGMKNTRENLDSLKKSQPELFNENGKIVVPADSVFLLGDNRHVSSDSSSLGAFNMSSFEGKVEIIQYYETSTFKFYFDYIVKGKFFRTITNIL